MSRLPQRTHTYAGDPTVPADLRSPLLHVRSTPEPPGARGAGHLRNGPGTPGPHRRKGLSMPLDWTKTDGGNVAPLGAIGVLEVELEWKQPQGSGALLGVVRKTVGGWSFAKTKQCGSAGNWRHLASLARGRVGADR